MPFFRRLDEHFLALQTIFGGASRAVWQCVPQNTLYPAIPCTVEKALDHPRRPLSAATRTVNARGGYLAS